MEFSLKFNNEFLTVIVWIARCVIAVAISYYMGRWYLDRQQREAEYAQQLIDECDADVADAEQTEADAAVLAVGGITELPSAFVDVG